MCVSMQIVFSGIMYLQDIIITRTKECGLLNMSRGRKRMLLFMFVLVSVSFVKVLEGIMCRLIVRTEPPGVNSLRKARAKMCSNCVSPLL